jgi:pilus assembly protein Flp/PilA
MPQALPALRCETRPHPRLRGWRLLKRLGLRLGRDENGTAAVQFAVVAVPFLTVLLAIVETSMVFWTGQVLQTAVTDTAREVYTGRFQLTNKTTDPAAMPGTIKAAICSRVVAMFDCSSNLTIDVQTYTTLPSSLTMPIVTRADGTRALDPSFGQYQNAGPNQIVLVRAVVLYPVFFGMLGGYASNLNASTRLLMGSAAFRTEPYI